VGVPLAILGGRAVASLLFGLGAADPLTLVEAVAVIIVVATVAGLLPARRAARVDPLVALRSE
jgi:ABC-type antimicrobial peptide transport system permease subunit